MKTRSRHTRAKRPVSSYLKSAVSIALTPVASPQRFISSLRKPAKHVTTMARRPSLTPKEANIGARRKLYLARRSVLASRKSTAEEKLLAMDPETREAARKALSKGTIGIFEKWKKKTLLDLDQSLSQLP